MPFLNLDDALVDMIEWARERLQTLLDQTHCGTDPWEADIRWDYPIQGTDVLDDVDMEATHAVGFIAGVAAAFNVTPLELLDTVKHLPNRRDERRALPAKDQCQTCGYPVVQGKTGLVHAGTVRDLRPHKVNGPFEDKPLARGIDDVTFPKTLTNDELRKAQGFGDCQKCGRTLDSEGECRGGCSQPRPATKRYAKRPGAKRRQKIRTFK